ncbi:MAG TPA: DUF2147 domain-containing protein [Lentimicrobium sp.]|nr:DUF2147 domain-containing protein [Lentimicrobium sp.]
MNRHRLLSALLVIIWGLFSFNLVSAQSVQADKKKSESKPVSVSTSKGTTASQAKPATTSAKPATPATPAKPGVKTGTRPAGVPTSANAPVISNDITGYWLTAQKATIVQFYKDGEKFNGKGVWSKQRDKNGRPLKDINNPDKSKRSRYLEGVDLITGLTYNPKTDTYEGGRIYQPNTGKTFNCKVKLDKSKNTMQVTGGVGFISKTLTWTRTSGIPGGKK